MTNIHIVLKINNISKGLSFFKEELLIDINREYTILDKFYKIKSKYRNIYYAKLEDNRNSKEFVNKLWNNVSIFSYNIIDLSNETIQYHFNEIWDNIESNASEEFTEQFNFMIDLDVTIPFEYDKTQTLLNWIQERTDA
jgi:hypothetical protein